MNKINDKYEKLMTALIVDEVEFRADVFRRLEGLLDKDEEAELADRIATDPWAARIYRDMREEKRKEEASALPAQSILAAAKVWLKSNLEFISESANQAIARVLNLAPRPSLGAESNGAARVKVTLVELGFEVTASPSLLRGHPLLLFITRMENSRDDAVQVDVLEAGKVVPLTLSPLALKDGAAIAIPAGLVRFTGAQSGRCAEIEFGADGRDEA